METLLTFGLVSVILGTASGAQNLGIIGAIGVGSYIALAGLWGSPISGASMNPARTFGPDLVIRNVDGLLDLRRRPDRRSLYHGGLCLCPPRPRRRPGGIGRGARRALHRGTAGAGLALTESRTALVDAVGRLVDAAVHRVLLGDDRVTSAADAKLRLSGQAGTEELADKVQRVVVLATPVVRLAARGARFTRLPWALVASSSVSVGIAVRAGVREIQVLSSLVAYRIEQATGAPADPRLVEKVAVDLYLNPKRRPDLTDDRLRLVRLTRKWVLLGAFGRRTSKRAGKALEAADKLDGSDLATRWGALRSDEPPSLA